MSLEGRRVLYISYNGMLDPLGQSQVLPYLRELASRGVMFTLLSFERAGAFGPQGIATRAALRDDLATKNIQWHLLKYHKRPSLPATMYDVIRGTLLARKLARQDRIEMVHARGQIPGVIALALKKTIGLKTIFDVRGLLAEEYVDAAHWREGSVRYRLTKTMETRTLAAADGIVTLTRKIWPIIKEWEGLRGRDVVHEVIPCCTDLKLFRFRSEDRERLRKDLGIENKFVLVYSGSIGSWYLTEKMAEFFGYLKRTVQPDAHFLWLTNGRPESVVQLMRDQGISGNDYTVTSVSSGEVPSYLSASDAAIAFITPAFSKLASSPTKHAEYLACGLPLIINAGIGDSNDLVIKERVGILLNEFSEAEYRRATEELERLTRNVELVRRRTREVAERLFDVGTVGVEGYARLYQRVLVE